MANDIKSDNVLTGGILQGLISIVENNLILQENEKLKHKSTYLVNYCGYTAVWW